MSIFPVEPLRQAFLTLPKQPRQSDSDPIDSRFFYVPTNQAKALHPDILLVEGGRGVGKSEWWLQLSNPEHLKLIAAISPRSELEHAECSVGFGEKLSSCYPSKQVLRDLLLTYDAETIWNVVISCAVLDASGRDDLKNGIRKYQQNYDYSEMAERNKDDELYSAKKKHIILVDALEYATDDWDTIKKLLKGLLQVALKYRSFRAIRLKIFVRPEMLEDSSIYSFSGGAKVISNKLSLEWSKLDLFGLLWQYLGNAPEGGEAFRNGCEKHFQQKWEQHLDTDIWLVPDAMRRDEALQRKIFHALTGEWMGDSAKSGNPYVWLPNHLEDGLGKISPSTFLAALHEAAASDDLLTEEQQYPLNYQAIKKGVQQASLMQVRILNENNRWIEILFKGKEISFPCDLSDIESLWWSGNMREKLEDAMNESGAIPPPGYSESGFSLEGIKNDLITLGIFQPMLDGRINMPDVYRVGYGLSRKGGISPVK